MLKVLFGSSAAERVPMYLQNHEQGQDRKIAATFGVAKSHVRKQLEKFEPTIAGSPPYCEGWVSAVYQDATTFTIPFCTRSNFMGRLAAFYFLAGSSGAGPGSTRRDAASN